MKDKKDRNNPLWEHGKVPPQAVDLEEAVLGQILTFGKELLINVAHIFTPDIFYKDSHQIICNAIKSLYSKNEPIDILTVTNQLKFTGELELVGGPFYITELTNCKETGNTEFCLRIIIQKHIQREVIRISSELIKQAFEDTTDVFDLVNSGTNQFVDLNEVGVTDGNSEKLGVVAAKVLDTVEKTRNDGFIPGIPTKLDSFDKIFNGFISPDLVILASRPGMGKTALMVTVARNIVKKDTPIAIFSLEMSNLQIAQRFFLQEVNVSYMDMTKATDLADGQILDLKQGLTKLEKYPLYLDDTAGINPSLLRAKLQKLVRKNGVKLAFVDYLQLMNADPEKRSNNREQEVSSISRSLKAIAKDLDIPIIALAQLSRAVESRGGSKKPLLSDLRESGSIEQDADSVVFLYRPAYYNIEKDEEGFDCKDTAELIIAKHRNGNTGPTIQRYIKHRMRFINEDDPEESQAEQMSLDPNLGFDDKPPEEDLPF